MNYLQTRAAEAFTTTSGGATVAFGLSYNEAGVIIGVMGVLSGMVIQGYFGHKRNKREQELHNKRMKD